ncbi:MAG TPA: proline dehydrogenase family protein, partial [Thermomicrobiales bacterium]|nr:proline dehydrogenase family protein [Thermomicrobiales bacterium]
MSVMRKTVLAVSDNPAVKRLFRTGPVKRRLVDRFVAGETLESALDAARAFSPEGITTTLDLLGENVTSVEQARTAVESYMAILPAMRDSGIEPNISVKLTMLGLDFGADVARTNVVEILESARDAGGFVRIDMEGSAYTDVTMRLFEDLYSLYPAQVGIVIQAYLHRAE